MQVVDGERLVVAEREDGGAGQEAGAVDRAVVVANLEEGVVFVGEGCGVDVDEAVCAAG